MGLINGTFSIKCNKCKKQIDFQEEDTDFEMCGSERNMGRENGYIWESEFNCYECNDQEIEFRYEFWEYPIGAFNYENIELKGATEISRFEYDFHGEE